MRVFWNPKEDHRLRRMYPDMPTAELAKQLRRSLSSVYQRAYTLGLRKSAEYLASPHACRLRRGDQVGREHRFKPGQVPANKGLRRPGWGPGRMKETQFRRGERRGVAVKLYQPIGAERLSKDGYLERKINDDLPLQARWRAVHLVVWEKSHGHIPDGHAVVFRDGNKQHIDLANLELISRAELMRRNTVHRLPKELAQVIQLAGALKRKIRNREKKIGEKHATGLTQSSVRNTGIAQ